MLLPFRSTPYLKNKIKCIHQCYTRFLKLMQKHISSFETSFDKMLVILKLNRKVFFCHKFSIWPPPTNEQKWKYWKTGFMIFSNNYISCIWNQFPSFNVGLRQKPIKGCNTQNKHFSCPLICLSTAQAKHKN